MGAFAGTDGLGGAAAAAGLGAGAAPGTPLAGGVVGGVDSAISAPYSGGKLMPPSFRTLQKWMAISNPAIRGKKMQWST